MLAFALSCATPFVAFAQQTPVPVAPLVAATWRSVADLPATVVAAQAATLAPARAGIVASIRFTSGQPVNAGDILVQLANGPESAQLAVDTAKLAQAERDAARTAKLMKIAGASESAEEQAQAALAEAHAQVQVDNANLADLTITAPFAGICGIRTIDAGDFVSSGQPVVTLTAPGPLRILFSIPQAQAQTIAGTFTLHIAGLPPLSGQLTALSPQLDPATNARPAEGSVPATPGLVSGMAGMIDIATGTPTPAYAVPATALNDSTLGPFLFAVNADDTVTPIYVTVLGLSGSTDFLSPTGLAAGTRIVTLGGLKLSPGAKISPQ